MARRWGVTAGAWLALAGAAAAGGYDATELFAAGDWAVAHVYDAAEGGSWCTAETENTTGQVFSVVGYDFGVAAVVVFDPGWRLEPRSVEFSIAVDGAPWAAAGEAEGGSVSTVLDDAAGAAGFVAELVAGRELAVESAEGGRMAAFSLDGAAEAVDALMACWARIAPPAAPPAAADWF